MSTLGEAVEQYIKEYKEADECLRFFKRNIAIIEFFKWELIKEGIAKIDEEAV